MSTEGAWNTHKIWLKDMDDNTDNAKWRPLSDYTEYLPERYKNLTEEQKKAGHWEQTSLWHRIL